MLFSSELLNLAVTFGLVFASVVVAWFIGAALGGWKFGKFLRQIEVAVERAQLSAFTDRLHHRLMELGFTPTRNPGEFLQGAQATQNPGAFTHAGTSKQLNFSVENSTAPP